MTSESLLNRALKVIEETLQNRTNWVDLAQSGNPTSKLRIFDPEVLLRTY